MAGESAVQAVLVIGDSDTAERMDMLEGKAAEHGARIIETFAFPEGAAVVNEDLTNLDAVVAALGRAIATRTPIWCPFPLQDLCREQHIRRLSLSLQRRGLNLLMGPDMTPCPVDGGYSEIDAALRNEVRAVDELDRAGLAAAASRTLSDEIEAVLRTATPAERAVRGERIYTTREAAGMLGRSPTWLYGALRHKLFRYSDGSPVEPLRIGSNHRRRYTSSMLRAMARSCLRSGVMSKRELSQVLAELARTERSAA